MTNLFKGENDTPKNEVPDDSSDAAPGVVIVPDSPQRFLPEHLVDLAGYRHLQSGHTTTSRPGRTRSPHLCMSLQDIDAPSLARYELA